MKKIYLVTTIFISAFVLTPAYSAMYNPDQLKRFEESNQCSGCDLSSTSINSNHSGAVLNNANLSNIVSYGINFSSANLQNANLSFARLDHANFSQADLSGAHFDGALLYDTNFFGAKGLDLTNTYICHIILPDGQISGCD